MMVTTRTLEDGGEYEDASLRYCLRGHLTMMTTRTLHNNDDNKDTR